MYLYHIYIYVYHDISIVSLCLLVGFMAQLILAVPLQWSYQRGVLQLLVPIGKPHALRIFPRPLGPWDALFKCPFSSGISQLAMCDDTGEYLHFIPLSPCKNHPILPPKNCCLNPEIPENWVSPKRSKKYYHILPPFLLVKCQFLVDIPVLVVLFLLGIPTHFLMADQFVDLVVDAPLARWHQPGSRLSL